MIREEESQIPHHFMNQKSKNYFEFFGLFAHFRDTSHEDHGNAAFCIRSARGSHQTRPQKP